MKRRRLILLLAGVLCMAGGASAHGPISVPKLIHAVVQAIPVSLPEYGYEDQTRIILVWKSSYPPSTFFWRPKTGGWQTAAAVRVHRNKGARILPGGDWYTTEEIDLADVKRGDTLEISPMKGGRDVMPPTMKTTTRSALYFKAAEGPWQFLRITAFRRLPAAKA